MRYCVLGLLLLILNVSLVFAEDEAKEFVLFLPQPIKIDYRFSLPDDRSLSIGTFESGNLVSFEVISIVDRKNGGFHLGILLEQGFSRARAIKDKFNKFDFGPFEVLKDGPPPAPKVIERGFSEQAILGIGGYYYKRFNDAPDWNGEGEFLQHLKKTSKIFEENPQKVLLEFIGIADEEVAILQDLVLQKAVPKKIAILLEGFIGLYKPFREKAVGGKEALPIPPKETEKKDEKKKEDVLAVHPKSKLPTMWASLKKGELK